MPTPDQAGVSAATVRAHIESTWGTAPIVPMAHVWLSDDISGYRITVPLRLAERLVEALPDD